MIDLPAADIESESVVETAGPETTGSISILVIDDEPPVRETLADMLEALKHRVVLAESGQAALKKMATESFDLIFSDLAMPEMDGWETAREIRKRWPEMKIVLVTGYGPGTRPPKGEDDLVNAIIGKPFDFNQVSRTITQVIGNGKVLEKISA
jgi:CheY-like chemotaxis protein